MCAITLTEAFDEISPSRSAGFFFFNFHVTMNFSGKVNGSKEQMVRIIFFFSNLLLESNLSQFISYSMSSLRSFCLQSTLLVSSQGNGRQGEDKKIESFL